MLRKALASVRMHLSGRIPFARVSDIADDRLPQAARARGRDGYVKVRHLRLHYFDYGGGGEVAVALPGLVQTARAFDAIAPVLVPHVRLLAFDLRGRGESDWASPGSYQINEYLLDLKASLSALGLQKVALIGTSLGGFVAMLYAAANPLKVTRLVLNDCLAGGNLGGIFGAAKRTARAPSEFADLDAAKAWFLAEREGLERLDGHALTSWVSHYLTPTSRGGLGFRCDPVVIRLAETAADNLMRQLGPGMELHREELMWQWIKRLTMPVLLLRGSLSQVVLPSTAARLLRELPSARCVEVAGVGHSPTLYEPEAQAAVGDFFGVPSPLAELRL
jgi:pimeloyl-ACP methyl ester carboxylesterase